MDQVGKSEQEVSGKACVFNHVGHSLSGLQVFRQLATFQTGHTRRLQSGFGLDQHGLDFGEGRCHGLDLLGRLLA